ncbi:MAG: 50S ribosomal protein L17 [Vicinamibacteria bacterium]
MRHRVAHRKLGRTTEHRISLLRNLAASLFIHERIRTTLAKAKELRPFAERLITLSKKDSLHARRQALRIMVHKEAVTKLFRDLSARFADRPGGYTRILKLGPRRGDGAPMAYIELVDFAFAPEKKEAASKKDRAEAKPKVVDEPEPEVPPEAPEAEEEEAAAAAPKKKAKKAAAKRKAAPKKKTASKAGKKKASKKKTKS